MKKINRIRLYSFAIIGLLVMLTNSCKKDENNTIPTIVKDIDGNVYHTVTIGTQVWLVENLNVIHYRNGDPIPIISDSATWCNITTGAYCDYKNTSNYGSTYGKLYNWYTVNDSRNIAPIGWHVPTYSEWTILTNYLGDDSICGGRLKEIGFTHWSDPNTGATNETGLTALPAGFRNMYGTFGGVSYYSNWWCTTEFNSNDAFYKNLNYVGCTFHQCNSSKRCGYSVRCIKDK
jgi:uncharacterized protein (TIGR02145 family)